MIREMAIEWLAELNHYPTILEMTEAWGGGVITILLNNNDIIFDGNTIILTAVTSEKQQKLMDESISISEFTTDSDKEGE